VEGLRGGINAAPLDSGLIIELSDIKAVHTIPSVDELI
jgi:hypothetical protein